MAEVGQAQDDEGDSEDRSARPGFAPFHLLAMLGPIRTEWLVVHGLACRWGLSSGAPGDDNDVTARGAERAFILIVGSQNTK